ncbi:inner membrane protein [Klebsiella pneumoniae]|nr:inner membrane protein [Klebsiella pneumoniae]
MKAFDWQRMALDKVPVEFLAEVALRSPERSPHNFPKA